MKLNYFANTTRKKKQKTKNKKTNKKKKQQKKTTTHTLTRTHAKHIKNNNKTTTTLCISKFDQIDTLSSTVHRFYLYFGTKMLPYKTCLFCQSVKRKICPSYDLVQIWAHFTHFSLEAPKRVNGKKRRLLGYRTVICCHIICVKRS